MAKTSPLKAKPAASKTKPAGKAKAPPPPPESAGPEETPFRLNDPQAFGRNMAHVAASSQRLLSEFLQRQAERVGHEPFDPLNLSGAFFSLLKHMAANPGHMFTAQIALWRDYLNLLQRTTERAMGRSVEPFVVPAPGDRRFRDKDWQENQVFDFIKQSYLLTSNWLQKTVGGIKGMDEHEQARALFYAKQFADAIAPSNFVLTNPEVLRETLRSN